METVLNIFRQIEATTSRNEKEAILSKNKDNELLKKILYMTYNPYLVYGIGSKAFGKKFQVDEYSGMTDIFQLLDYLLIHNSGSDKDKIIVNSFINSQPAEDREWYKRIVLKDLKIGATATVFNKIWKELIPSFTVMLAQPFERLPKRAGIEYKFDGVRATAIKENGTTSLFTRNGKAIEGFNEIIEQINKYPFDNIVLDGELISNNNYKETMEKVFKKTENKTADYMIFDALNLKDFKAGRSIGTYDARRANLEDTFNYKHVKALELTALKVSPMMTTIDNPTVDQLDQLCKEAVELGFEGVMVKDMDAPYVCKRDYGWQKVKIFETDDYPIIGFEEGSGKLKGSLGKVIIDVDGVSVGVGSGWTEQERKDIWENQNTYLGLYLEVRFQEKIEKTGSLRFPTVVSIRYDK